MMKQIYVVEDDQDIRQIIEFILEDEGYKVRLFPDISSFHAAMKDSIPDLYLLDVMLPDGNGLELCREIRTMQRTKDIPIIVMSAHASADTVFQQCSANDFISKPFDLNDILFRIKKQITLH
ncbi:response regulator transcription factor [Pedobacter cryoconitis]|uniref:response regulator transcription factor n=1 Tax=Pedobacter cryoconitis TaxID=188932 RepID=UPI000837AF4D|nr:response regulator [Pedobacter cryoconitis]